MSLPKPNEASAMSSDGRASSGGGRPPPRGKWQPPTVEELQQLLPKYEILRLLGQGGMGAVYMGRQISLDRRVAIKILSADLDDSDQGFAARFKHEARAMAKLNHPGIVAVHDSGETGDGLLFIVMEFVEGSDVQAMMNGGQPLATEHAMAIAAHVCDALAYAHECGVIHRDIKPSNIMVGYNGTVKVADFGLAKISGADRSAALTQSGMALGTLHYMAPEALTLGGVVDHRADIYAVGVMLFQMLVGKVPRGLFQMPSKQLPGLDHRYDDVITKALQDNPALRYQSAAEIRADLDRLLTHPVIKADPVEPTPVLPTAGRPQRPKERLYPVSPESWPQEAVKPRRKGVPLFWAALLALGITTAWFYWDRAKTPSQASAASVPAKTAPPTEDATHASPPPAATKSAPLVASAQQQSSPEAPSVSTSTPDPAPRSGSPAAAPAAPVLANVVPHSTPLTPPLPAPPAATNPSTSPLPPAKPKPQPFTNTLGMTFVPVPGTKVLFCTHETRKKDYALFATSENGNDEWRKPSRLAVPVSELYDHPVVMVSWEDADRFCKWLSLSEKKTYRLPTDREWSIAVGIGDQEDEKATPETLNERIKKVYPWGSEWPPPDETGNFADTAMGRIFSLERRIPNYMDGFVTTAPVMSFKPNVLGIYDLSGNVWEWTDSRWSAGKEGHVIRGGSWVSTNDLLSSARRYYNGTYRSDNIGFRCVLEAPSAPAAPPLKVQTWTDTQGRSLVATYKESKDDKVILLIDGRAVPVALSSLSAASQQQAREDAVQAGK